MPSATDNQPPGEGQAPPPPDQDDCVSSDRLEDCSAYQYPHAFINKSDQAIVIKGLDPKWREQLRQMYLGYEPKGSFSGLPPLTPEACTTWVDGMIAEAVNLIAMSFEGGVIGHTAIFPSPGRRCEMLVVVSPPDQNHGIGTELVRCTIHLSHALGFEHIWASIELKNLRCRHVLRKCGFECLTPTSTDESKLELDLREFHDPNRTTVHEVMDRHVITIHQNWSCRDAVEMFLSSPVGSLPVVNDRDEVVGILSQTDLLVPANIDRRVGDICTRKVIRVDEDCSLARVIHIFQTKKIWCVPVLDVEGRLAGVVTREDIIAYFSDRKRR